MASLLANKKAIIPLIKFLKVIQRRVRKRIKGREMKYKKQIEEIKTCENRLKRENLKVAF